jgi:Mg2+ and Co2+ transporter CorA
MELAYSQYCSLPTKEKKEWLNEKRRILNSRMEYIKKRENRERLSRFYFLM